MQRMGRRDKCHRRHDDLTGQIQRPNRELQGDCAVAGRDAVLDPKQIGDPSLQFLHIDTVIAEPATVEDVIDPR